MPEIIPAIMPDSFLDIEDGVREISGVVPTVQIDVMDGKFVPGTTWPYGDEEFFEKIITQETTLPRWEKVNYEVDLMVSDPEKMAEDWIAAGASRVIIHSESNKDYKDIVRRLYGEYAIPDNPAGIEIALAVPFDSNTSVLEGIEDVVTTVQVMGISPVGVQGSQFQTKAYETIKEFRDTFANITISVDGGVKPHHISELIEAGADRIVMGSAIFGEDSPREALRTIMSDIDMIQ